MTEMRLWHQSFTELGRLPGYPEALHAHMGAVARAGTEIVLHGMHPQTYQTNYPGIDIRHTSFQYLHGLQFMAAAIEAETSGFDAFLASTLPDPALREVRAITELPVVSYGETAMHTACQLGSKFGVLVFIEDLVPRIEDNVRQYGLSERCAGVRHAGFRFDDVLEAMDNPTPIAERFSEAARPLIEAGADTLIPGEAPLCLVLRRAGLRDVDGAAIVDPLACLVKSAESLVDLRRTIGLKGSRRGYFHARPNTERRAELARLYGLDAFWTHDKAER